jgi:hypothetical protein
MGSVGGYGGIKGVSYVKDPNIQNYGNCSKLSRVAPTGLLI